MLSLIQLLTSGRPAESPVCFRPFWTWRELQIAASHFQDQLPAAATKPWLLAVDSTFQFAAALLAGWHSGIPLLISPETQSGSLELLRPGIGGVITDRQIAISGLPVIQVGTPEAVLSAGAASEVPSRGNGSARSVRRTAEEVAVELFTSGSTGQRKRVSKTFAQLDHELAALHQQWGHDCQGLPVASTVSHLHIYGLLFKVLWPLCRGDSFHDRVTLFWDELLDQLPDGPAVVISSPAHLRLLPDAARQSKRDWNRTRFFSSGGPLRPAAARAVMSACGRAPVEVYGSTETGGVAFRQQTGDDHTSWQPLPGVTTIIQDGLLLVRSPWLAEPENWLPTGDQGEPDGESGFQLMGRADGIAKISEKRISLAEIEARIRGHPMVNEACAIVLPSGAQPGRDLLGVVVELSPAGCAAMAERGKAALIAEFKRRLQPYFEAVTIPRRWRFVAKLPEDAQGKIPRAALLGLFAAQQKPTDPIVLKREQTKSGSLLHLQVPPNLAFLEGHFPRVAVVPGVCQLKWVIDEITALTGRTAAISTMTAVKFHELLLPGQQFWLELGLNLKTGKWDYRLFRGERTISSGRLQFAP